MKKIDKCDDIKRRVEGPKSKNISLVLFSKSIEKARSHWVLTELARREQFLFKGRDLSFFWIPDPSCITAFGAVEQKDATTDVLILFTR